MKHLTRLIFALVLLASGTAQATWSVAAVNHKTGTLAVAGASCSYMVYGIATVIPGKGVVIVQAASNAKARTDAAALLEAGKPLPDIMAKLTDPASGYDEAEQQYALLSSAASVRPLTYTGAKVEGAKGAVSTANFTVQANTMVSDAVVARTVAALGKGNWADDRAMAQALMRAMQAGATAGGDKRCQGTGSASAFISLFRADDPARQPWLNLVIFGIKPGTASALDRLEREFKAWHRSGGADQSTQLFVVPKAAKTP